MDSLVKERSKQRDEAIGECDKFLSCIKDDSERYDIITDEIDKIACEDYCGNTETIWTLVRLVIDDSDYNGNKKRLLKHLARKWDVKTETLTQLENAARELSGIRKSREDLKASDKPYKEVAPELAKLNSREQEILATVYALWDGTADKDDSETCDEDYQEEGILDKIGDGVVDVIHGVTDGITGVIDGFTNAVMDLW
jgi:hypothetical protein